MPHPGDGYQTSVDTGSNRHERDRDRGRYDGSRLKVAVHKANQIVKESTSVLRSPDVGLEQREEDYAEEQFHDDLAKAEKQIDAMAAKALQSFHKGRVRNFRV